MKKQIKNTIKKLFLRRRERGRYKLKQVNNTIPRLAVFRSKLHIYAQIIDDTKGITIVATSTVDKTMKDILKVAKVKNTSNQEAAAIVGQSIAEKALKAGVDRVVFDRSGYIFHGRIKSLAEKAREKGLKF